MSTCQELNVLDILDTTAGLCIYDVRSLLNRPMGLVHREDVHADLSTLRSRTGPNKAYRKHHALSGLSDTLLLCLAGEFREWHLCLQCRTELVPA